MSETAYRGLDAPAPWTRTRTLLVVLLAVVPVVMIAATYLVQDWMGPAIPAAAAIHGYLAGTLAGLTAIVMVGYAVASRRTSFLAVAGAYTVLVVTTFTFPLFYPNGLVMTDPPTILLGGTQSAIALFIYKNTAFPIFLTVAAVVLARGRRQLGGKPWNSAAWGWLIAGGVLGVLGLVAVWAGSELLPVLLVDGEVTVAALSGFWMIFAVCLAGTIVVALLLRSGSQISLWIFAVLTIETAAAVMTLEAEVRYSGPWYANRILGTAALAVLLLLIIFRVARIDRSLQRGQSIDPLTGGLSRLGFLAAADEQAALKPQQHPHTVAILWLNVDTFRVVNEQWGYPVGDEVFATVFARVRAVAGRHTVVGRLGGDEVGVLLSSDQGRFGIDQVARDMLERIRRPVLVGELSLNVSASIGIAEQAPGATSDQTALEARLAMKAAKKMGGDRATWFDPTMASTSMLTSAQIRLELDSAVKSGQLFAHYQALFDSESGEIAGFEALARWNRHGAVQNPGHFLDELSAAGALPTLGRAIVATVSGDAETIWETHPGALIFLNFSAGELSDRRLQDELLASYLGTHPQCVVLEVTEHIEFDWGGPGLAGLARLREAGFAIALDDFGAGFSNLQRIGAIRPDVIKMDQKLLRSAMAETENDRDVFGAACQMALALGATVVAEGIESSAEVELAREAGARWLQGFHLAMPAPVHDAVRARPKVRS